MSEQSYPRIDGAFLVLGPEIFTGDGVEQPQDVIAWKGRTYRLAVEDGGARERIRYAVAAQVAIDDAAEHQDSFDVGHQLSRAQAYATLASAEQARIANLLAWKQLQIAREKQGIDAIATGPDAIDETIERALEIDL